MKQNFASSWNLHWKRTTPVWRKNSRSTKIFRILHLHQKQDYPSCSWAVIDAKGIKIIFKCLPRVLFKKNVRLPLVNIQHVMLISSNHWRNVIFYQDGSWLENHSRIPRAGFESRRWTRWHISWIWVPVYLMTLNSGRDLYKPIGHKMFGCRGLAWRAAILGNLCRPLSAVSPLHLSQCLLIFLRDD